MTASPTHRKTNPLLIALAWTVVAVPLAWGVSQTVMKSLPLFHGTGAKNVATTKPAKPTSRPATNGATVAPATGPTSSPTTHDTHAGKRKKKK